MKFICLLLCLLVGVGFLSSCASSNDTTLDVGKNIISSLGEDVKLYYSLADETEGEYMPSDLIQSIFADEDNIPRDFTLILSRRRETIVEIGILLAPSRSMAIDLSQICLMRIRKIEKLTGADGEVMIEGNLVIYYVTNTEHDLGKIIRSSV